jgi:hypothetical protein
MSNIKSLAIAAALLVGASSLAMSQSALAQSALVQSALAQSTQNNAGASGGPGTHAGAMKSGSAENNQKVEKNQNGYAPGKQTVSEAEAMRPDDTSRPGAFSF